MLPSSSSSLPNLALHSGKDLAVSPPMLPSELALYQSLKLPVQGVFRLSPQDVSVRTSWITPDGRYPLPIVLITLKRSSKECSDFPPYCVSLPSSGLVNNIHQVIKFIK